MSKRRTRVRSDEKENAKIEDHDQQENRRTRRSTYKSGSNANTKTDDKGLMPETDAIAESPAKASRNTRKSSRFKTPTKKMQELRADLDRKKRTSEVHDAKEHPNNRNSDSDFESDTEMVDQRPATLFDENEDVSGRTLFAFQTPKKRNGMSLKAAETPVSAFKSLALNSPSTPKSAHKRSSLQKTPHFKREKMKSAIAKSVIESDEDDSEEAATDDEDPDFQDDDNESSSSEGSAEFECHTSNDEDGVNAPWTNRVAKKNVNRTVEQPAAMATRFQQRKQQQEQDFFPQSDNYFSISKKIKTSNATLDRLKSSSLQYDEVFAILDTVELSEEHRTRTADMNKEYETKFYDWMILLNKGFNVCVSGLGSKQCLLQRFCETHLAKRPVIVINGFFPTLTVKDILHSIRTDILNSNIVTRHDHETVDAIAAAFHRSPNTHLFLVINNIDGPMLRKTKDQHILSRLAKIRNIHLIASVDHINAPLMWDSSCISNFNFVWWDCTTMLPYVNETAFENSAFLQNTGELGLAAMSNVFKSLTKNARGIYMLLVKSQLAHKKDANYSGMTFKNLYNECRKGFYVNSDLALRTQLTEFVDHNMVKMKRNVDGTDYVSIPIAAHVLEQFIEHHTD